MLDAPDEVLPSSDADEPSTLRQRGASAAGADRAVSEPS